MNINDCIVLEHGTKTYKMKESTVSALNDAAITIERGKFYAIMGHSGSGKTTLIQILGLLDNLTSGKISIGDKDVSSLSNNDKAYIRMKEIGFVFQAFYLNSKLKAFENVMLPMYINKDIAPDDRKSKAFELLDKFSLSDRSMHYPKELSAGEQQRIAIARALANSPNIILADEPTGNLDKDNEKIVFDTLKSLTNENRAVVVVSHNEIIKEYADMLYHMDNGVLRRQS